MNAEVFAEWMRRQGRKVVRTASSYWHDQGPRIYQAFPYHWVIEPDAEEITRLLYSARAVGVRYSTPMTAPTGMMSYHVVLEGGDYSLDRLPKKARYDVRRAARQGRVEQISMVRLADEGWQLRAETLQRQGRSAAESPHWWRRLCLAAVDLAGIEAWGVLVENTLAASLLLFICDDTCCILYQQSRSVHLAEGVNNLLAFMVTERVLQRPGIRTVFYGLDSFDAPHSVDAFKFRMGYQAKPVRQRVVFHPWLAPFCHRISHAVVAEASRRWPGHPALAKTEGVMRFYLEGQRSLSQQVWPERLRSRNAELVSDPNS